MIPIFIATVEKDRLKFDDPKRFSIWLGQFIGKSVEVTVRKRRKSRSTGKPWEEGNQNGYYRAVVLPISAEFCGYTANEMHEIFIQEFAPYNYKSFGSKNIAVKIRTSQMDTAQMATFTDACRIKMAELGCMIPDPDKITV